MSGQSESLAGIARFLSRQHILSLATSSATEVWCANCFYAFEAPEMALYLMTELETRHGAMMAANPVVTGTIARQTRTVTKIQGVQFRGKILRLEGDDETRARAMYCQRFPVAQLSSAPVWRLTLVDVKMTDNTVGFGKKSFWTRGDDQA